MDNKQILEQAIKNAIEGGWNDPFGIVQFNLEYGVGDDQWSVAHTAICIRQYSRNTKKMEDNYYPYELFIYNKEFAKALWGEGNEPNQSDYRGGVVSKVSPWKKHLQQMVIAEDPIKYLGENI